MRAEKQRFVAGFELGFGAVGNFPRRGTVEVILRSHPGERKPRAPCESSGRSDRLRNSRWDSYSLSLASKSHELMINLA